MKLYPLLVVCFLLHACGSIKTIPTTMTPDKINWQGHRGCRGILAENTIPSFIKALEYPHVRTLELDVVVSKDKQIIVSHEAWFSEHISSHPDGRAVTEEEAETLLIYQMTYEEIKQYDVGKRGNPRFPEQQAMAVHKPSFKDMVETVEEHCRITQQPLPYYNIELKTQDEYYGTRTPHPNEFIQLMLAEIEALGIKDRINLQSFSVNLLNEIYKQDNSVVVAYLVDNLASLEKNLKKLDFLPQIYSPSYKLVSKRLVEKVHAKNMKIIPWTVNKINHMQRMMRMGVDGIITDYPNRISTL